MPYEVMVFCQSCLGFRTNQLHVTLSIVPVEIWNGFMGMAAAIINNTGDKGLLSLISLFVFVSDILMLNSFAYISC